MKSSLSSGSGFQLPGVCCTPAHQSAEAGEETGERRAGGGQHKWPGAAVSSDCEDLRGGLASLLSLTSGMDSSLVQLSAETPLGSGSWESAPGAQWTPALVTPSQFPQALLGRAAHSKGPSVLLPSFILRSHKGDFSFDPSNQ